jgi:3-hydroxybutyryl-CoA dehydratase
MEKMFFEDYQIGEVLASPGRTITETDIIMFAAFTGDWHPIHTNVEYAKKTIFGERIAHGMLGLTVGSALIFRLGPYVFTPKKFIAFYGIDKIRFIAPIKIGDTIRCEAKVAEMNEHDEKTGVISYEATIKNQRDEDCIVFTPKILVGRKG